jgi:hypothetical protein
MRSTRKLIEKKYLSDKLVQNREAKPPQEKPQIQPTPPDTEREHIEPPKKQYTFFIDNLKRISPFPNKRHSLCASTAFGTLHSPIWELNRKIDEKHVAPPTCSKPMRWISNAGMSHHSLTRFTQRRGHRRTTSRRYPSTHFEFPIIIWLIEDDALIQRFYEIRDTPWYKRGGGSKRAEK